MNTVFLITGGNTGNRLQNLEKASQLIEAQIGDIVQRSEIYETEPWGKPDQPPFYNQVLKVHTDLTPGRLLHTILSIEQAMGRRRTTKNAARNIDIDILFFNDAVIRQAGLVIPHPEIPNRQFVLKPLCDMAPDMVHPVLKKSIRELLSTCPDQLKAIPLSLS